MMQMTPLDIKTEFSAAEFRRKSEPADRPGTAITTFETIHRHKTAPIFRLRFSSST